MTDSTIKKSVRIEQRATGYGLAFITVENGVVTTQIEFYPILAKMMSSLISFLKYGEVKPSISSRKFVGVEDTYSEEQHKLWGKYTYKPNTPSSLLVETEPDDNIGVLFSTSLNEKYDYTPPEGYTLVSSRVKDPTPVIKSHELIRIGIDMAAPEESDTLDFWPHPLSKKIADYDFSKSAFQMMSLKLLEKVQKDLSDTGNVEVEPVPLLGSEALSLPYDDVVTITPTVSEPEEPLELFVGKPYLTRAGQIVMLVHITNHRGYWPVVGYFIESGNSGVWSREGKYHLDSDNDIVSKL